jgi:hypothetical protein
MSPHPSPLLAERELIPKKNDLQICGKNFYKIKSRNQNLMTPALTIIEKFYYII